MVFFFFSSRRRHTRYWRDWSSDVCSSDLRYVAAITGLRVRDATSGFRCYTKRALRRLLEGRIRAEGYAFLVEATFRAHRAGLDIAEVPITFTDRREGKSKISRKVIFESVLMPWRLRLARRRAEA